ncbi:MAG: hypothetical protein LBC76_05920 [Treponema sp.]|nr:hypothetical protein [Treponema sp.]
MWPPLFAWLVGMFLAFLPLGSKHLIYRMFGIPVGDIFNDIEILYICVTASAVFICYTIQGKFEKGNKTFIIMDVLIIIIGTISYAICKCGESISQRWPFIEVQGIEQILPGFIKFFFITVSALNIFAYALLPKLNSPAKNQKRS